MRIHQPFTALSALVVSVLVLSAGTASAAPIAVNVRIEGATETLFEGPVAVEPHGVKASSDPAGKLRSCNGINPLDPGNSVPEPTPTSAAADAMALIGETFDARWYPGFNDYFITRFGPDREVGSKSWGLLVNDTFTDVGGCQFQLDEGDEVLWIYNAFNNRPELSLLPAGYGSGSRPLTATATLNQPFEVEVRAYADNSEDDPPAHPELAGSNPFKGASVAPVTTNAKGFEKVLTADPATRITGTDGKAQITFTTPGWHRIKATVPGSGEEAALRSNRIDVCVPAGAQAGCGALPAEDQVRIPPPTVGETEAPGESSHGSGSGGGSGSDGGSASGGGSGTGSNPPAGGRTQPGPLRLSVPKLDRSKLEQGKVGVAWKVLDGGVGIARWTIPSQTVGTKGAPWVKRASGTTATAASLRLPRGATYRLRFTVVDAGGKTSNVMLGKVVVPGVKRP
jgi:uncharacterized membrane protein YgcG